MDWRRYCWYRSIHVLRCLFVVCYRCLQPYTTLTPREFVFGVFFLVTCCVWSIHTTCWPMSSSSSSFSIESIKRTTWARIYLFARELCVQPSSQVRAKHTQYMAVTWNCILWSCTIVPKCMFDHLGQPEDGKLSRLILHLKHITNIKICLSEKNTFFDVTNFPIPNAQQRWFALIDHTATNIAERSQHKACFSSTHKSECTRRWSLPCLA